MNLERLEQIDNYRWRIRPAGFMRVPGIIYGSGELVEQMDEKVYEQVSNVAALPGIVGASYAMPDAHWGYGFCIGGVAGFDPDAGGVISAGGVGFDIACGVRTLHTGLKYERVRGAIAELADCIFRHIPSGLGSTGNIRVGVKRMDALLMGGAKWCIENGYGIYEDLEYTESGGAVEGAEPRYVSEKAKKRQQDEMGTLGSGNHYLEIQRVSEVYDKKAAEAFGIEVDDIKVSIHCGSRGLGHQIGTDYLKAMAAASKAAGISLPEKELACAPVNSPVGVKYLGAMRAGINCALANRQILTHLTRQGFERVFPTAELKMLYDVCHNTYTLEEHEVEGQRKSLFVHRKGATRSFGPGSDGLVKQYRHAGQPVLIGGSMGTCSYILAGTGGSGSGAFGSASHGAGRVMSRGQAKKQWHGRNLVQELEGAGILIRSSSMRSVAEEAPGAYKDVSEVIETVHNAGLAKKVARLVPIACIKG